MPQLAADPIALVKEAQPTLLSRGYIVFLRLLAVVFLVLTVRIWLVTVGYGDEAWRFDRLDAAGRAYLAAMAVLNPISAVGLWTTLSWGRVVWLFTVAVQIAAGGGGVAGVLYQPALAPFHLATVAVFIGFTLGVRITTKKG